MTRRKIVGARPSGRPTQSARTTAAIARPLGRAPAVAIGILAMAYATAAVAQQAVIDRCKQTSSDADRIACLEAALLGKELVAAEEPEAPIDRPSMEPDAVPADADVEPVPAAVAQSAPETQTMEIGAEQVLARTQTREEKLESLEKAENLVVSGYHKVPYERLVVTLENGQQWRQIKGDTRRIRVDLKRNQTVDINESSLGGYIMQLNEMRISVRVERIK